MIHLTDIDGKSVFIDADSVESIRETTGYRTQAMVKMRTGERHEVRERAADINDQVELARTKAAQ